jgi:hypothetical protein
MKQKGDILMSYSLSFNNPLTTIRRDQHGSVIQEHYDRFDSERYVEIVNNIKEAQILFNFKLTISDISSCVTLYGANGNFMACPDYDPVLINLMAMWAWIQEAYKYQQSL